MHSSRVLTARLSSQEGNLPWGGGGDLPPGTGGGLPARGIVGRQTPRGKKYYLAPYFVSLLPDMDKYQVKIAYTSVNLN